jgi:hypothetical protein
MEVQDIWLSKKNVGRKNNGKGSRDTLEKNLN